MSDIHQRQNAPENIRKLQAQRQTYSDIKYWMIWIVMIGVILPILISFLTYALNNEFFSKLLRFEKRDISYLSASVGISSTLFVGMLSDFLKRKKEDAAKIQELFDTSVFDLPWDSMSVGDKPDTGMILKKSKKFNKKHPNYTGFVDWYTIKAATFKYPEAIVFCQQQNLHWDNLLRKKIVWLSTTTLIIILVSMAALGILNDFSVRNLLTNVLALLFPICWFFYQMITEHTGTIKEMERLRRINDELIDSTISNDLSTDELILKCRQLQTAIYNHRKLARPIPNLLHKISKEEQEEESADRMQHYLNEHQ